MAESHTGRRRTARPGAPPASLVELMRPGTGGGGTRTNVTIVEERTPMSKAWMKAIKTADFAVVLLGITAISPHAQTNRRSSGFPERIPAARGNGAMDTDTGAAVLVPRLARGEGSLPCDSQREKAGTTQAARMVCAGRPRRFADGYKLVDGRKNTNRMAHQLDSGNRSDSAPVCTRSREGRPNRKTWCRRGSRRGGETGALLGAAVKAMGSAPPRLLVHRS